VVSDHMHLLVGNTSDASQILLHSIRAKNAYHHMHTCTSHARHMHVTCTSHARHMHITCTSHARHMHVTCTSHAPDAGGGLSGVGTHAGGTHGRQGLSSEEFVARFDAQELERGALRRAKEAAALANQATQGEQQQQQPRQGGADTRAVSAGARHLANKASRQAQQTSGGAAAWVVSVEGGTAAAAFASSGT
jgi:hypothetical protein